MTPPVDLAKRQQERVAESKRQRAAAQGQTSEGRAPARESEGAARPSGTTGPQPRKGDRWTTFNSFVDVIAPQLTLAERSVWLVMFRHARNGKCETTARLLAVSAKISITTAQSALSRLHRAGLVWPIWKSKDKAHASKYGIHPSPTACLDRLLKQNEPCQ